MKSSVRWLLFEYQGLELVILSKPFKTKKLAEKARLKYPDRVRRRIGIGVVRVPSQFTLTDLPIDSLCAAIDVDFISKADGVSKLLEPSMLPPALPNKRATLW